MNRHLKLFCLSLTLVIYGCNLVPVAMYQPDMLQSQPNSSLCRVVSNAFIPGIGYGNLRNLQIDGNIIDYPGLGEPHPMIGSFIFLTPGEHTFSVEVKAPIYVHLRIKSSNRSVPSDIGRFGHTKIYSGSFKCGAGETFHILSKKVKLADETRKPQ